MPRVIGANGKLTPTQRAIKEKALAELRRTGPATAERLVEMARNPRSAMHGFFDWDNRIAGEKMREKQAADIIAWCQRDQELAAYRRTIASVMGKKRHAARRGVAG